MIRLMSMVIIAAGLGELLEFLCITACRNQEAPSVLYLGNIDIHSDLLGYMEDSMATQPQAVHLCSPINFLSQ